MKKDKIYREGMAAGAKPFYEVGERIAESVDNAKKEIDDKMEKEFATQSAINDYFNEKHSVQDRKSLYDLDSYYDIKNEDVLSRDEQEYLLAYLSTLANKMNKINENQRLFFLSIKKYLGIVFENNIIDCELVENIQTIQGQQVFLQTVLEFLFLQNESFEVLKDFESELSCFNVGLKKQEELKKEIEMRYSNFGIEAIVEKYVFHSSDLIDEDEKEDIINENSIANTKMQKKVDFFDGSDISEACADFVNANPYIEVEEYLICSTSEVINGKIELYKVAKETGEYEKIRLEEIEPRCGQNIYGHGEYIYFVINRPGCDKYICKMNITDFSKEKISIGNRDISEELMVNDHYIIYRKGGELYCYNQEKCETELITKDCYFGYFYLLEDILFYRDYKKYYCYEIMNKKNIVIDSVVYGEKNNFLYPRKTFFYKDLIYTTTRNGKIVFVDINNPLAIQEISLFGTNEKYLIGRYGKIYYFTCDVKRELREFDLYTKEDKKIREGVSWVDKYETGFLKKETHFFVPYEPQIVGHNLYMAKVFLCSENDRYRKISC